MLLTLLLTLLTTLGTRTQAPQEVPMPAVCMADAAGITNFQACADATPAGSAPHSYALINLATNAYLEDDFATAVDLYDRAIPPGQKVYSDVFFHTFRADTYHHVGRDAEALEDARTAWAILSGAADATTDPRDRLTLDDAGRTMVLYLIMPLLKEGSDPAFAPAHALYLSLPVNGWLQQSQRAAALERIGDFEGALAASALALDEKPNEPGLLNNHCYTLVRAGRPAEGLTLCERAVAAQPGIAPFRQSHAAALAAVGRCDESLAELAEAQRLDPSGAIYREPLACTPV